MRADYWLPRGCSFYIKSSDTAQGLLRFLCNHSDKEYRTSDLAIKSGYDYQETKSVVRRLDGYKVLEGNRTKINGKSVIQWRVNLGFVPAVEKVLGGGIT